MNEMNNQNGSFNDENNPTPEIGQENTAVGNEMPPVSENNEQPREYTGAGGSYGIGGDPAAGQGYRYQPPLGAQDPYASRPAQQHQPYQPYGYQQPDPRKAAGDQWQVPEYPSAYAPKKKKGRAGKVILGIAASLLSLVILGFAGFGVFSMTEIILEGSGIVEEQTFPQEIAPEQDTPAPIPNTDIPSLESHSKPSDNIEDNKGSDGVLTTAEINEKVSPSVVGIIQYRANYLQATGQGSGIILSEDGYIATNAHVIEGADSLEVVLPDGRTFAATAVGADTKTDLAVVKIEATGLIPAELGRSGELKVGEKAVAIGNPGGLLYAGSVTEGIISGLNRGIRAANDGYTMNFIQTDAAISPGNSGGALVNEFGQVVGINSQKKVEEGYDGLGFAIPIDEALPILEDLMTYGRVTGRVKLGITCYELNEYLASVNGVPSGILIDTVDKNSSLHTAGIVSGDIITKIEGTPVNSLVGVSDELRKYKPGDKVTLTVFRATQKITGYGGSTVSGETFDVTVTLQEDTEFQLDVPYSEE